MTIFVLRYGTSIDSTAIQATSHSKHHIPELRSDSKPRSNVSTSTGLEALCLSLKIDVAQQRYRTFSFRAKILQGLWGQMETFSVWAFHPNFSPVGVSVPLLLDYLSVIEAFRFLQKFC